MYIKIGDISAGYLCLSAINKNLQIILEAF